jgi:hypothetical protein
MKRLTVLSVGLLAASFSFGQIITLQAGKSFSSLNWNAGLPTIDKTNKTLVGYSYFVGVDYLDKTYFNLSSNFGIIKKGGQATKTVVDASGIRLYDESISSALDFVSFNTTFVVKYSFYRLIPFLSVGPRFDYLMNDYGEYNKSNYGLILGGGLKYKFRQMLLGIRADYYLNFNDMADLSVEQTNLGKSLNCKTIAVNMTIGYRIK